MRYVRPKSVTWWAGFLSILLGALGVANPDLAKYGEIMGALIGAASSNPLGLIATGAGMIGLKDHLERERVASIERARVASSEREVVK